MPQNITLHPHISYIKEILRDREREEEKKEWKNQNQNLTILISKDYNF
jgi:hypothetical protein